MPAPLSVIIPTLNAARTLGPTLGCLFEAVEAGVLREVVIVDGGSQDEIEQVAADVGAEFVRSKPGRGSQLAAGAAHAQGEWLLFVHADTVLSAGWSSIAAAHWSQIEKAENSERAGYFALSFDEESFGARFVAAWANFRSRFLGLPYGDQGLLVSRRLYQACGGFGDEPLMEDVAIARRLSGRLVALDARAMTSAARYVKEGWLKRGTRNLWTLIQYFCGVSPERLAARYRSKSSRPDC